MKRRRLFAIGNPQMATEFQSIWDCLGKAIAEGEDARLRNVQVDQLTIGGVRFSGVDGDIVIVNPGQTSGGSSHARLHTIGSALDHSGALVAGQHGSLADGDHSGVLSGQAKVAIKSAGSTTGTRHGVNMVAGSYITLSVVDDAANDDVDVTVTLGSHVTAHHTGGTDIISHIRIADTGSNTHAQIDTFLGKKPDIGQMILVLIAGTLSATSAVPVGGWIRIPRDVSIESVEAEADTAPTGANIILDIHRITAGAKSSDQTGTTVYSSQGNRPAILAAGKYTNATLPNTTILLSGDVLRFYVDQVGSGTPGSNVTVAVGIKQMGSWN